MKVRTTWGKIGFSLGVAAFIAVMLGGPMLFIPGHPALFSSIVCEEEQVAEIRYGARDSTGAQSVQVCCVEEDEDSCVDRTGHFAGVAIGSYMVPIFAVVLIITFAASRKRRRRK